MAIQWDYFTNQADADLYFTEERLVTAAWDALTDANKAKCVQFAYNRIFYNEQYNLPTLAAATAAELVILRKVTGELAFYVAEHLDDEDRRKGIQAQGTIKAGIVKEDYFSDWLAKVPLPPIVIAWLKPWDIYDSGFYQGDIDRDEDESVDENVTDY